MRICHECGLRYTMSDTNCGVDGHKLYDTEDLFLGEGVGSYRVTRLLGEGGMGSVYLAVHPQIKSRVAIKVLTLQASCHAKTVERFFAEAQSVNRIRHDGIVKVLDLSYLLDGRPYIVMEYLDGFPLSHWLSGPLLPLGQVREYVMQMLAALAAVHQAGIVHRDLKPDNIFVSPQGTIRLLDFGIAKLLPEYQDRPIRSDTQSGTVLGTPHYMAPEQIEGGAITPATDIYSIGAILYEAVTGQTAFRGDSLFALFACVVSDAPIPPQQFRAELSASMQEVILRAMAKNPGDRFSSAREMADALAAAEGGSSGVSGYSTTVRDRRDSAEDGPDSLAPQISAAQQTVQPPRTQGNARLLVVGGLGLTAVAATVFLLSGGDSPEDPEEEIVRANTMILGEQTPKNTSFPGYSHTSPSFDVKAFDAGAFVPEARKLAENLYPDAFLVGFDMPAVFPSGTSDLTMGDFEVTYNFLSPKHSIRTKPVGMEDERACWVYVEVDSAGVTARIVESDDCTGVPRPNPKCSVAEVWQRAIRLGAPKHNTVANMDYLWDGWFFDIDQVSFTESIADDC